MEGTDGRPSKRHRAESGFKQPQNAEEVGDVKCDTKRTSGKDNAKGTSKYKSKRTSAGILNTMDADGFNGKNKKAISVSELKNMKEQSKNSAKKFTSIIDLKDESDTSMNGGSSPFKIIRSSQDFNFDATVDPKSTKASHEATILTPKIFRTRPSSDDGIFWVTTPNSNNKQNYSFDADLTDISAGKSTAKLPSSPLKTVPTDIQLKDASDSLLDPEVRSLLNKYESSTQKRKFDERNIIPTLNRASSDSKALTSMERNQRTTQIIATKSSINESLLKNMQRKKRLHRETDTCENQETSMLDFSGILAQLGSKLRCEDNNSSNAVIHVTGKAETIIAEKDINAAEMNKDDDSSDAFSDDIDFSIIEMNATQAVPTPVFSQNETRQNSTKLALQESVLVESEDNFSDDDDDLMEQIELGMTQQSRAARSTTEQTDVSEMGDIKGDTDSVTAIIKGMEINEVETAKYKGMATVIEESSSEESADFKQFKLFDEKDNLAKSALDYKLMKRLQIKGVQCGLFSRKNETKKQKQVILKCIDSEDQNVNIMVRDEWAVLNFKENDVIHIVLEKETDNYQIVDKEHNLLIWNPDTLLSATRISDAISCQRKAIISQKFNGPGLFSVPFILGNIVHALFQECLLQKRIDDIFVNEFVDKQIDSHALEIFATDKSKDWLKSVVMEHFSYIKEWIEEYVPMKNQHMGSKYQKDSDFKATKILDIEENIMSPIYGIRGLIDVVIEARLRDGRKFVVPLEIKTGQQYISNSAQVSLYTLLIKQRYGVQSMNTSLVYTKLHKCCLDAVTKNDLKALINIRNELSQYLAYAVTDLPPILGYQTCERCYIVEPCMTLNKLLEDGSAEKSGINAEMYEEITGHLNDPRYREFFTHWDKLITKEEGLLNFTKTELWRNSAEMRESNGGNCIGSLRVAKCEFSKADNNFMYLFERDPTKYPPLTASQLSKNDRVILSDEESMFGLSWGYIKLIRPDYIVIMTERNWSNSAVKMSDFNELDNQTFRSVLRKNDNTRESQTDESQLSQPLSNYISAKMYRIDKDQMFHGMAMARYNLINLFLPDGDDQNLKLVVELKAPQFNSQPCFQYREDELKLNDDQLHAVNMVSKAEDYALILGMPGTGKTTLISSIINCIVKNKMKVLITSYTHSAVDNICEKLIKTAKANGEELPLVRLGSLARVSPIVKPYSIYGDNFVQEENGKDGFKEAISKSQIVATTCLGTTDLAFFGQGKIFDYCIIDEASQVALPIVLGPMAFASRFVLVGDHYQLPPLVIHPEAKQQGLDQSLFKILSERHPSSVCELTHQYRMCSDIMSLSNELIYDGRLKCGSEDVANQKLKMPYLGNLPIKGTCIDEIIKPERRVVFVNEDDVKGICEVSVGDKIENPGEAKLISILIKSMLLSGVPQESIGVMSFYKAQLRHFFRELSKFPEIEILTADRFQGRDKDVIIISLVRSEVLGELMKEWRRVNVAMTRAKCKLIIFGSKKLLESSKQFEGFMELIRSNGWYYDLKDGDEKVAEQVNFFGNETTTSGVRIANDSQSDILNHYSTDPLESQTDVKRLDAKSRAIRHTKILKYVIDEATK